MKRTNLYISLLILMIMALVGCSTDREGNWIEIYDGGTKIWISQVDTTLTYRWEGETFDSVAHGKGTLYVLKNDSVYEKKSVQAYYGALSDEDIVIVDGSEKYVGTISEEKFNGYGVYSKSVDVYVGNFADSKPHGFATWYKNGKPYYTGMWDSGTFHGEGTLYKEDGSIKSGDWEHGKLVQTLADVKLKEGHYQGYVKTNKPDGFGKMEYANGSIYSGKWKDGKYSGQGVLINGADTIVGDWENGKISGNVLYRTDAFFYEGTMIDNCPTGIGNLTVENNSFYTGNWVDGKRAGIGDMYFINGDSYSGEWDNNQFNGVGKYEYANQKASYDGEWLDGLQHGNGYYRSPEFAYRGEWEQGWMDGEGTLVFKNGDKYEGSVHENVIDGIGTYTFKDGNFYEGEFVNGQMTGLGLFHFKDGSTFEGEFVNGKIYGDGTLNLVENGKVVSITGFWTPDGKFPSEASILFPTGDLYEGPIVNGFPTDKGNWTSAEERQKNIDKIENSSLHKANELYKRNRETINWCLMGASAVVSIIEVKCAATVVGIPVAVIAHGVNVAINVVDAGMAIGSAAMETYEAETLGEESSEQWQNLAIEVGMNGAFIMVPKVLKPLGKGVKNVTRSAAATLELKAIGKNIVKKSAIKFVNGRIYGKVTKLTAKLSKNGTKSIEKTSTRIKVTVSVGRLLTRMKHQTILSNAFFKRLAKDPDLQKAINLTTHGNSSVLRYNMLLVMGKQGRDWLAKNIKLARKAGKNLQVEAHHILTSTPTNEKGRKAKAIFEKYFGSIDHPCNGFFAGRGHGSQYVGLAKGSNHAKHSAKYNDRIQSAIIEIEKKYGKKYANRPDLMQKLILEQMDDFKRQLYKGNLAITGDSHEVHTIFSIFKRPNGTATQAAKSLLNLQLTPAY